MYILLSKDVLKKSDTDGLTNHLLQWRKAGLIPWDAIADGSGRGLYQDFYEFHCLEDYISTTIKEVTSCRQNYRCWLNCDWRWYYQPHYVEFWSEKHAVVATVFKHIEGHYVRVAYNKGMPGWGYMHNGPCKRLKDMLYYKDLETGEHKKRKIHVWYLGDSDTYGHRMDLLMKEQLEYFGLLSHIEFKRIAVMPPQIREYGLIESFDKDKGYEIDALNAFNPNAFRQLLLDHIEPYFDKGIHKQVLNKFDAPDINRRARVSLDENYSIDTDD